MNVYEKLAEVQLRLKAPKSEYNAFGKYAYRSAEGILESVKPLLSKTRALLLLEDEITSIDGKHYLKAVAKFVDTEGEHDAISVQAYARLDNEKKAWTGRSSRGRPAPTRENTP